MKGHNNAFRTAAVVAFDRAESRTRRDARQPTQDWCIVAFDLGRWMAQTARDLRAAHNKNGAMK